MEYKFLINCPNNTKDSSLSINEEELNPLLSSYASGQALENTLNYGEFVDLELINEILEKKEGGSNDADLLLSINLDFEELLKDFRKQMF